MGSMVSHAPVLLVMLDPLVRAMTVSLTPPVPMEAHVMALVSATAHLGILGSTVKCLSVKCSSVSMEAPAWPMAHVDAPLASQGHGVVQILVRTVIIAQRAVHVIMANVTAPHSPLESAVL